MTKPPVYVFRAEGFSPSADTVFSVAPLDAVVSVYGGGGLRGEGGLAAAFGGAAFFRDNATGEGYLGVWGARKASRFRRRLREAGVVFGVVRDLPPARLVWSTRGATPSTPRIRVALTVP
jgi:hypothetical protein